jgi:hypothetical protein
VQEQTVSADSLPTVQVNGVVWAQVVVGDTVYATGNFTKARPAGAAPGTQEVRAGGIVAYNIRTGQLVASFNHSLNSQGRALAVSKDGSRLFLGGNFTTVDGKPRAHLAAFNTATGALDPAFTPGVNGTVIALATGAGTLYAGGDFTASSDGRVRTRVAEFGPDGALTGWTATVTGGVVKTMVLTPDQSRLVVGGSFTTVNAARADGMASLSVTTGATMPWAANKVIRDSGSGAAVLSLTADSTRIYGAGYSYQAPDGDNGRFEGRFAADPMTGTILWANDCQGDTYGTWPVAGVLYSVSHAHNCAATGSFPNNFPASEPQHRALAESTSGGGPFNLAPDMYGRDYSDLRTSAVLTWFPRLTAAPATVAEAPTGTVAVSGSSQAAWSVTANSAGTYVVLAGEMTAVNGVPQQGLARFAVRSVAPTKVGPEPGSLGVPTVRTASGTSVMSWTAAWDRDDAQLTYRVFVDGAITPVAVVGAASTFWRQPTLSATLPGVTNGTHTFKLVASDPSGNTISRTVTATTSGR